MTGMEEGLKEVMWVSSPSLMLRSKMRTEELYTLTSYYSHCQNSHLIHLKKFFNLLLLHYLCYVYFCSILSIIKDTP